MPGSLVLWFWFMLAAYVVHILDESLLGGSFVEKVRQHWWPGYSWRKFFWFNGAYLTIMFLSIVLYDRGGSRFLFLPFAWIVERFFNGIWHVWWTIRYNEYSPGLLTTVLIWMQTYFVVFYQSGPHELAFRMVWPGWILGILGAMFLSFYIPLVKGSRKS
jgi:hypothetical protein